MNSISEKRDRQMVWREQAFRILYAVYRREVDRFARLGL